jgi:hypothetical protein
MPDLSTAFFKGRDARIRELRPVVREFERLERAAAALARRCPLGARAALPVASPHCCK